MLLEQWAGLWVALPHKAAGLAAWLAVMAAAFCALERWRPIRRQAFLRAGLLQDIGFYFLGGLLPAYFLVLAGAGIAGLLGSTQAASWVDLLGRLPLPLRALLMIVMGDVAYYWAHRWSHELPWLWRFHRVHHSPQSLDWLVNTRAHPFDLVFVRTVSVLPLLALGLGRHSLDGAETLVALFLTAGTVWAFVIHANLDWRLGWLEHVIVSPAFHHWHHADEDTARPNRNYASLLPWIDRVFGTHHLPRDRFPQAYGVGAALPPARERA